MLKNYFRSLPIRLAFWILSSAMKRDSLYAWSWQCNLAMLAYDAGADHERSNIRAASFMSMFFGVDVTKGYEWKSFERQWNSVDK